MWHFFCGLLLFNAFVKEKAKKIFAPWAPVSTGLQFVNSLGMSPNLLRNKFLGATRHFKKVTIFFGDQLFESKTFANFGIQTRMKTIFSHFLLI